MTRRRAPVFFLFFVLFAAPASAEWFDDYDAGLKAARAKEWSTVISRMNAAIAQKPREGARERTYGTTFIAYHPYYYRGVAYLNQGDYEKAVENLRQATGVGDVNLGSPDTLLIRANEQLTAQQIRDKPPPDPPPDRPPPVVDPPRPDPAIEQARERAQRALSQARSKMSEAQRAQAPAHAASEFNQASDLLSRANTLNVSATSAAELRTVADTADRAARAFDAAISNAQLRIAAIENTRRPPDPVTRDVPAPPKPAPGRATDEVLESVRARLREALEAYFDGRFRDSARQFEQLSLDQSNNPMIWAFLGASKYYDYYLTGRTDAAVLNEATEALRRAKRLNPSLRLNSDYFSPRVVAFYERIQ